jgi:hypothetical protein
MSRAEVNFLSIRELDQIAASMELSRVEAEEESRLKAVAELCCLTYHLTKIPFIKAEGQPENIGQAILLSALVSSANNSNNYKLLDAVKIRSKLYKEAKEDRERTGRNDVCQSEDWVWRKVFGEEVEELVEEITPYLGSQIFQGKDCLGLVDKVIELEVMAEEGKRDLTLWLEKIFDLAQDLGVRNETGIFAFMVIKQRGRITHGKKYLSAEDKVHEWEELRSVAKECFGGN